MHSVYCTSHFRLSDLQQNCSIRVGKFLPTFEVKQQLLTPIFKSRLPSAVHKSELNLNLKIAAICN